MTRSVLLFAGLRDAFGRDALELSSSPSTVGDLKLALLKEYPDLSGQVFQIAVNHSYAKDSLELDDNSEVALIPPVSGG